MLDMDLPRSHFRLGLISISASTVAALGFNLWVIHILQPGLLFGASSLVATMVSGVWSYKNFDSWVTLQSQEGIAASWKVCARHQEQDTARRCRFQQQQERASGEEW